MWFQFENELSEDKNQTILRLLEETELVPFIEISQTTREYYFSKVVVQIREGKLESILTNVPAAYRGFQHLEQDLAIEQKILELVSALLFTLSLFGKDHYQEMAKKLGKMAVIHDE